MKRFLALAAVALLLGSACEKAPSRPTIPDFVFPDLSGQAVRARDLRGKVVVLNLWATWCLPCVQEMPTLERLHRKMEGRDLVVLAVSEDEAPARVKPWVEERKLTFPVLLDPKAQLGFALGVTGYPETFIVDRNGGIVHHHVGYANWADPRIVKALERLLETGIWAF